MEKDDPRAPDPAAAAEAVRNERAGEKPTKRRRAYKGTPEERRQWRERKQRQAAGKPEPVEHPEVTEGDIVVAAKLGGMLWQLSTMLTKRRGLNAGEERQLGEALAPVIAKYLPALDAYGEEIVLAMTLWTLWESTTPPKKPPVEGDEQPAKLEIVE